MNQCGSCSTENLDSAHFCSACGEALRPEYAPTEIPADNNQDSSQHSSPITEHGRFLPGAVIASRYRIVSLVGKGGMGEVYRADDLKLGNSVALKFLPPDLAENPQRLEYFHSEVRLTRQISHPNVCRVYDIGESNGQQFLSMEFIDGEDLGVLLRRIGKLPPDKGVQIAQQLCSGLAAAHNTGVLHRDLKPANIMLDGRGQVRITDFGLAKLASETTEGEIAGTPAYMAPEQLKFGQATIQSDLYALGLILHEVFTGEPVYKSGSIPQLIQAKDESTLSRTLQLPEGVDSSITRAIARCLETDPRERPVSALAVASALPGGDPLMAALAAGETPSPQMVAAAGGDKHLKLSAGVFQLVIMVMLLIGISVVDSVGALHQLFQHEDIEQPTIENHGDISPFSLAGKVRASIQKIKHPSAEDASGWYTPPRKSVYGFQITGGPSPMIEEDEKESSVDAQTSLATVSTQRKLEMWYREPANNPLTPTDFDLGIGKYAVTSMSPSIFVKGDITARATLNGHLTELLINPSGASPPSAIDLKQIEIIHQLLLTASDVDPDENSYQQLEAQDFPVNSDPPLDCHHVDVYVSSQTPQQAIIEGYRNNNLVYFHHGPLRENVIARRKFNLPSIEPLSIPGVTRQAHRSGRALVFLVTLFLGFRNIRNGRADFRGAFYFAMIVTILATLTWAIGLRHYFDYRREILMLQEYLWNVGGNLFREWLYDIAVEPYIRRYWPQMLIGWSRAMERRWFDPLLGREILMGMLIGVLGAFSIKLIDSLFLTPDTAWSLQWFSANSSNELVELQVSQFWRGFTWAIWYLAQLAIFRMLLGKPWLAVIAVILVGVIMNPGLLWNKPESMIHFTTIGIWMLLLNLSMTRWGFIAGIAFIFSSMNLLSVPLSFNFIEWYRPATVSVLISILSLTAFGFYHAIGGRSAFAK